MKLTKEAAEARIEELVVEIDALRASGALQEKIQKREELIKELKKTTGPRDLRGVAKLTVPLPKTINAPGASEDFDQWNQSR